LRLLLDSHAFLWWLDGDPKLTPAARTAIATDPAQVAVSAATAWEIATKARIGKLPDALDVAVDVAGCVAREGFRPLAVTIGHAQRAGGLPGLLQDPFDRMLIAQAMLISIERAFDAYGVNRLGELTSLARRDHAFLVWHNLGSR
jgi:PIN domain nuclease of toxin-antitoxin system